ncbi:MAG: hypothetical protein JW915_22130 [Chitinispirillaceae bacterium]|nr:hypothetical protein [Chitinispirillaceae bacterium]
MPGIFGLIVFKEDDVSFTKSIENMCQLHTSSTSFKKCTCRKNNLYNGFSQLGRVYNEAQYYSEKGGVEVWFDGELYNQDELPLRVGEKKRIDAAIILDHYIIDPEMKFLKEIDGKFAAVIYDQNSDVIIIANDRYGLQHIHWTQCADYFAWASEYKSLTTLPGPGFRVDTVAVKEFLEYGYLTDERTWLENVKLLAPASILIFNLRSRGVSLKHYWNWNSITIRTLRVDETECAQEWGRLFDKAMKRRLFPQKRVGITLSGGLDSRCILAALPELEDQIHSFTFGIEHCDDILIATKVAALKGTKHHNCVLNPVSWLEGNCAAVWAADGEIGLLDTIGNEYLQIISEHIDICFNGIGGDALHGGSFLTMHHQHTNSSGDPYGSRGRRYIRQGFRFDESFYHVRCPFYDNKLLEFQLSLPTDLRKKSNIYNKILLHNYPAFFKTTPWQKTGLPISYPAVYSNILSISKKSFSHLLRAAEHFGLPVKDKRNYVNHLNRTLLEPGRSFIEKLLTNPDAIYAHFFNRDEVAAVWSNHLHGKHNTALINRYATMELWFQQFFEKKYRPAA